MYTFTTEKFKPLVKEDEHGQLSQGQKLIAACLVSVISSPPSSLGLLIVLTICRRPAMTECSRPIRDSVHQLTAVSITINPTMGAKSHSSQARAAARLVVCSQRTAACPAKDGLVSQLRSALDLIKACLNCQHL